MRLGLVGLAVVLTCLAPLQALAGACRTDTVFLKGDWGRARFSVELADDAKERARRLMHRDSLATSAGMLFVYPYPQKVAFWMRNTLIPLDMIFLDETGTVTRIHENAVPGDETPVSGGKDILFVLEINGGMSGKLGLGVGSVMRHPSVTAQAAAWPC